MFTELVGMTVEQAIETLMQWGEDFTLFMASNETIVSIMVESGDLFVTHDVIESYAPTEEF